MANPLLEQMVSAGLVDDRAGLLAQKMKRGQSLFETPTAQGMRVGGTYVASSPFEHLATLMAKITGGRQIRDAEKEMQSGIDAKRQARLAYGEGGVSPTLGALAGDSAITGAAKAQTDADERARQAQQWNQDFLLRQAGAERDAEQLAETIRHNQATETLTGRSLGQDAWAAVADPVTGGIVAYNRKTGEVRPLGPGGGTPAPSPAGGPRPPALLPGKPTEAQRKAVAGASESITQLDMAIDALGKAPGAYGGAGNFIAGLAESAGGTPVQSLTARRYSPDELRVKNYVSNVVSKIINERAGANVTLREELRQKFLPQDTDGLDQATQKLGDLRAMVAASYEAQGGGVLTAPDESTAQQSKTVRVRRKSDGKTGTMPAEKFNPDLYEHIQ